ncbi:hypothetical protein Val02_90280 [Virgisporangium aliadipatigenens]|uniref:Uncharacterized protein n=1 Tax=Virgisporangium aliadipatigenens TaxID=741659 RepID=A0A8J3YWT6_9ACTN|nr:hypothetical protein [Virgisporangium aliadipatigenens]GIJ52142.1 hypothetical protein Val02_90280 [Virgisporangium aliadipatigenens]
MATEVRLPSARIRRAPVRRPGKPRKYTKAWFKREMWKRFRLPGIDDPAPEQRRLAAVCVWAATLGFGGAILVLRLLFSLFYATDGWYEPTVFLIGVVGVFSTVGAFASIHRERLPWMLLIVGTMCLVSGYWISSVG